MFKLLFLSCVVCCESVYVYSSFWAPLSDPRILEYRVDATFHPESGKVAREMYERNYGTRGESLIADLGNGKGLRDTTQDSQVYGGVKLYYIHPQLINYK